MYYISRHLICLIDSSRFEVLQRIGEEFIWWQSLSESASVGLFPLCMHIIDHGVTRFKTSQVRKKRRVSAISDHFEPRINVSRFVRLFTGFFGPEAILAWFHNLWNHINMSSR